MKCIFCTPNFDFSFESAAETEFLLKDIVVFKKHLSKFASDCPNCIGKDLVCLIGRSGSGKSSIANLLLQKDYLLVKNSVGGVCIDFRQEGASKVGYPESFFPEGPDPL